MIWTIIGLFGDGEYISALCIIFAEIFILFTSFPVHECAHAWAAYKLGDDTARLKGRLTLSPMAHLDLIGTLMILFLGVGFAKPVPVNIRNFKNRKRDFALTSLAGPVSNLIMAFLFFVISNVFDLFSSQICYILSYFFYYVGYINVCLAVFNLLPVPPLDGSRIATAILPDKYYYTIMKYERYIMIGLFVLLMSRAVSGVLSTVYGWVADGVQFLADLPFRLIG
ncbi:MAG: site-2 protease family protein [Clostridia bacterium]|nr:site-2 protease family protein [Clostridia bacterium]